MTTSEILGALTTALLLGILIGWLWRRLGERRRFVKHVANSATPQLAELEGQAAQMRAELEDLRHEADQRTGQREERAARGVAELTALHQTLHAREEEITHLHAELARRKVLPEPVPVAPEARPEAAPKPATPRTPSAAPRDDLKAIFGIGPVIERLLNGAGITTYRQIAGWTADEIAEITSKLSVFPDRIEKDNWVQGAKDEHFRKYGERV